MDQRRAIFGRLVRYVGRRADAYGLLPLARQRRCAGTDSATNNADAIRRSSVVVYLPPDRRRPGLRPPRGQAVFASWVAVLRLSDLPSADVSKLPRGASE